MVDYLAVAGQLAKGAVGLLPSDTLYGLSCRALDESGVERIYELKGREGSKPLIILLANIEQAAELGIKPKSLEPLREYWPAPLSIIVPAGPDTPHFLHRGTNQLALRIPANDGLRELLKTTGPLISTSANPSGKPPAKTVAEAKMYFGEQLDFHVDIGRLEGPPSNLAELRGRKLHKIPRKN